MSDPGPDPIPDPNPGPASPGTASGLGRAWALGGRRAGRAGAAGALRSPLGDQAPTGPDPGSAAPAHESQPRGNSGGKLAAGRGAAGLGPGRPPDPRVAGQLRPRAGPAAAAGSGLGAARRPGRSPAASAGRGRQRRGLARRGAVRPPALLLCLRREVGPRSGGPAPPPGRPPVGWSRVPAPHPALFCLQPAGGGAPRGRPRAPGGPSSWNGPSRPSSGSGPRSLTLPAPARRSRLLFTASFLHGSISVPITTPRWLCRSLSPDQDCWAITNLTSQFPGTRS